MSATRQALDAPEESVPCGRGSFWASQELIESLAWKTLLRPAMIVIASELESDGRVFITAISPIFPDYISDAVYTLEVLQSRGELAFIARRIGRKHIE
jgi:hypothetical protein